MPTYAAPLIQNTLRYAAARSFSRQDLLRRLGLREEDIASNEARVPAESLYRLLDILVRELDDPGVPIHIVQSANLADLHVMGFAVMTSLNAQDAIERACRYYRLLTDTGFYQLDVDDEQYHIRWVSDPPRTLGERLSAESAIAGYLHHMRSSAGRSVVPTNVSFTHPAPEDLRVHRSFFRGPVRFSADYAGFSFLRSDMKDVVPQRADPALNAFFVRHAEGMLEELGPATDLVLRSRDVISRVLASGEPSIAVVSKQLGMSERTLRRALKKEGSSFRELVDDVRRCRAESLLQSDRTTISEIAFLLGFSDASAFSRAFRRWCGVSPQAFRQTSSS
ncbi:MAG: AraC family transcriptional regulator [Myxococcota bacterium]